MADLIIPPAPISPEDIWTYVTRVLTNLDDARAALIDNLLNAVFFDVYLDAAAAFFTKTDSGNFKVANPATNAYDNNDATSAMGDSTDDVIWIQLTAAYPVKLSGARIRFADAACPGTAYVEYLDYKGDWIELASLHVVVDTMWEPTWTPVLMLAVRVRIVPDAGKVALLFEIDPRVVA